MLQIQDYKFLTNVSLEGYQNKTDASACLSSAGAKAIGRETMAFIRQSVTVTEFLKLATNGHAFCNLFKYEPKKKYWFKDSSDMWYQTYPEHHRGNHKGAMKVCMKSDAYFEGSQIVFVDVDNTKFGNVTDYLSTLTYPPTCVYMSFSDRKEKKGVMSRRFRMVYVFNRVLNKDEFIHVSQTINDRIVFDTAEPMQDDCGTRVSQYMNGVYGNNEVYQSDFIYCYEDFPKEEPDWNTVLPSSLATPVSSSQQIKFDERMVQDMNNMPYNDFMHYYSWQYPYKYRMEKPDWIDGLYQLTDEDHLQLWFYREKQVDGQHRRRKLFKNACLRRLMFPDMDPNTMLFNIYVDFVRFFENCEEDFITLEMLMRKVKHAFEKTPEQLIAYCNQEINYWHANRPQFIIRSGTRMSWGLISDIRKRIRYNDLDSVYDRSKSVQENLAMGIDVPQTTLYRYCNERGIPTNPHKSMTEAERRAQARHAKVNEIELFKSLYQPLQTVRDNQAMMAQRGLTLSIGTICNWRRKYIPHQEAIPVLEFPPITFEIPSFDLHFRMPNAEPTKEDNNIQSYSWGIPEFNWQF